MVPEMDEHEIRKYVKSFAMWARLHIPKVIITLDEDPSITISQINFPMEPNEDRWERLKFALVCWLFECVKDNERYKEKVAELLVYFLWKDDYEEKIGVLENT